MYTLEGFDKEYVKKIYQNTVLYSIFKYNELDESLKPMYNKKYRNALELKDELGIIEKPTKEEVKAFLDNQKEIVEKVQDQNQESINDIAKASVQVLKNEMPEDLNTFEKYQYIFDFVTGIMKFDQDWCDYCGNVPPIDGYDFMFDNGVPVSKTYGGLLVTRIGNSDDITNLMIFLGREIGVEIDKTYCKYNSKRRAINYITSNEFVSYMDPVAVIKQEKEKKEVFLVSEQMLDYKFKNTDVSVIQIAPEPRYNMEEIITKINKLLPQVNYNEYMEIQK